MQYIASLRLLLTAAIAIGANAADDTWRASLATAEELKDSGQFDHAERAFQLALRLAIGELDAAPAATVYHNMAGLHADMGRCDLAVSEYQRSLHLWEKAGTVNTRYWTRTANHLTSLYLECGDLSSAERLQQRIAIPQTLRPEDNDDSDIAQALCNLGSIHYSRGRHKAALAAYEKALTIWEHAAGPPSVDEAVAAHNLAFSLVRVGRTDAGLERYRLAMSILAAVVGKNHPLTISGMANGASLYCLARRCDEGEPLLKQALASAETLYGERHQLTAAILIRYAAFLKYRGRKHAAIAMEHRARDIVTALGLRTPRTVDIGELSRIK
jgi:tetratricopeptide (TPR) repeat protein